MPALTYATVALYSKLKVRTGTDSNNAAVYKEYIEEDIHRPLLLPSSTFDFVPETSERVYLGINVTPRKGRELTDMELPVSYMEVVGLGISGIPKFIEIEIEPDKYYQSAVTPSPWLNTRLHVYGWVDSIEPVVPNMGKGAPGMNTRIRWHIDWFLTENKYARQKAVESIYQNVKREPISYGHGTFKRGPEGMARPDPGAPRKWVYKSASRIKDIAQSNLGGNWAIFLVSASNSGWNSNTIKFFPIDGSISGSGLCPGIQDIMNGNIISMMGTSSDKIIGAWFSPVAPYNPPNASVEHNSGSTRFWYSAAYTGTSDFTFYGNMPGDVTADDSTRVQLTDMLGNPIYALPWGMTFNSLKLQVDIGANGSQLIVGFINYDPTDPLSPFNEKPETDGRTAILPLPAIPLFSNAMSDYVYSGQREFDIDNAKMQREQAVWSGVANLGSSVIGGAVAGSVAAPGAGTIAGAVAGFASGTIGVGANAVISTHYDIKSQEMTDKLVSNQAGGVVQYGGGDYSYRAPFGAAVLITEADPLSKGVLATEHAEIGYVTDVFTTNCTPTIQSGGPVRIEGLEVKGDIPKVGRLAIAAMFAQGVHLDLIQ